MKIVHNNKFHDQDDLYVWQALKKGDSLALSCLFNRFYNDLYFYGLKLADDTAFVSDTIQDVFANIWESRDHISEVTHVKAYLYSIFRNSLFKTNKKESHFKTNLQANEFQKSNFNISPEDIYLDNESELENKRIIEDLLSGLSSKQKEIIYLKFYGNYSNIEIAKILEIKQQSVANLLARTIHLLKERKKDHNLHIFNMLISSLI